MRSVELSTPGGYGGEARVEVLLAVDSTVLAAFTEETAFTVVPAKG